MIGRYGGKAHLMVEIKQEPYPDPGAPEPDPGELFSGSDARSGFSPALPRAGDVPADAVCPAVRAASRWRG
ncbi:MAG: hypothetical protein MZV70_60585 [Desulfobacterales bacterium]|nr:hypothetical protein [Desulfobacterales bacterium]